MRVFIYGFKRFGKYRENVTEEIMRNISARRGLKKKVFEVAFREQQFLCAIDRFQPDLVIGLGQCPRGKKLRIERKACNKKLDRGRKTAPTLIHAHGPAWTVPTLHIAPEGDARLSYDAGIYVCNFSLYVIAEYLEGTNKKFAFVHIPAKYDPGHAARFIEHVISAAEKGFAL